jgi:chemosensory pili system protein ChpC
MAKKEVRTIMAPMAEGYALLPNTAIAEILEYTTPEPFKQGPGWLLGELAWHGWQVPVISYLRLIDDRANDPVTKKARILIIKTLGESTQVNYIGLLIQGLPKLKTVTAKTLIEQKVKNLPDAIFSKVTIDDLSAYIPELSHLTSVVEEAAYGN